MWSFQEICLCTRTIGELFIKMFVLMGWYVCAVDEITNKSNVYRLFRVDSGYICIKPRGNKKELLIKICVSS